MDEELSSRAAEGEAEEGAGEARCVWQLRAHAGAINCIAARGDLLATASRCARVPRHSATPSGGDRYTFC